MRVNKYHEIKKMNPKKILLFGIIVISILIIPNIPLISVTEEISTQIYTIEWDDYAVTTFIVKKGWTLSFSYTSDCEYYSYEEYEGNTYPTIKILGPDDSIVWEQSSTSESEFILLSESGGSYNVYMYNTDTFWYNTITITAKQTGKITIIDYFLYFIFGVGLKIKY